MSINSENWAILIIQNPQLVPYQLTNADLCTSIQVIGGT